MPKSPQRGKLTAQNLKKTVQTAMILQTLGITRYCLWGPFKGDVGGTYDDVWLRVWGVFMDPFKGLYGGHHMTFGAV